MDNLFASSKPNERRRGAIAVLAAVFMVIVIGMIAFAVDVGYLEVARTQLQAAADAAALAGAATANQSRSEMEAAAIGIATSNTAAGRPVQLASGDIHYGTWDTATRYFAPSALPGNAVRVTVRTDDSSGGKTSVYFGSLFGIRGVTQDASAVATMNPRDIAFVVDLSGSMNDDTEPDSTATINSTWAAQGYPSIGTDLLNQVYVDFGWPGRYPNETSQFIGQTVGATKQSSKSTTLSQLTSYPGKLSGTSIPSQYRITSSDSSSTRTRKAYAWIMEVQMPAMIPGVTPIPNYTDTSNYDYWKAYIDANWDKLGQRSYMQYMMYNGRDAQPGGMYTPLSLHSSITPMHEESTAGGTFSFPPREQPTHAARRSIIAALKIISDCNQNISDVNQRDWVSIITFDRLSPGPTIIVPLTSDYSVAMQACTTLQAVCSNNYSTATETGLIAAANHIKPQNQGGAGRTQTNKIVVLLTDGQPNLYSSSSSAIGTYRDQHPSPDFYGGSGNYPHEAALMQTSMMQGNNWYLYPVGIGLDTDYNFMDRMARMGATANNSGQSARGSGNPADYEARLTDIFEKIITNPKLRLVQ